MTGDWLVPLLLVAGGLGALARYGLTGWVQRHLDSARPYGTVVVNLVGTALLTALVMGWRRELIPDAVAVVVGTGFCGGFTTFSTWMLEVIGLGEAGRPGRRAAVIDLVGQSVAGVVVATALLLTG